MPSQFLNLNQLLIVPATIAFPSMNGRSSSGTLFSNPGNELISALRRTEAGANGIHFARSMGGARRQGQMWGALGKRATGKCDRLYGPPAYAELRYEDPDSISAVRGQMQSGSNIKLEADVPLERKTKKGRSVALLAAFSMKFPLYTYISSRGSILRPPPAGREWSSLGGGEQRTVV